MAYVDDREKSRRTGRLIVIVILASTIVFPVMWVFLAADRCQGC